MYLIIYQSVDQMINALGSKAFSFWGFTFLAPIPLSFLGTDSNGVRQSSCSLQSFSGVCWKLI